MEKQNEETTGLSQNSSCETSKQDELSEVLRLLKAQNDILISKKSSQPESKNKNNSFLFFIFSIIINVSLLFGYHYFFATKIKVYDMNKFIRKMQEDILSGKISQKEAEKKIQDIALQIKQVPPRTVVLFEDIVLHNGEKIAIKGEDSE